MNIDVEFECYLNLLKKPRSQKVMKMFNDLWERFSISPASSKHHGVYPKGLKDHTINVVKAALDLYETYKPKDCTLEEILFCSLVHDIGKIGMETEDFYFATFNGYEKNEKIKDSHELLTLFWLNQYEIKMSEKEMAAIFYHAGPYIESHKKTEENSLLIILHTADNLVAKIYKI